MDPDASKARCCCSPRLEPCCSACRRDLGRSFWAALSSGSESQRRSLADSKRSSWFPKDRVAAMNGWMVMLGALGALSATFPAELLFDWSGGWRGLFAILAVVTVASALTIWVVVPEATSAKQSSNE